MTPLPPRRIWRSPGPVDDFWAVYGFLRSGGWAVESSHFVACLLCLHWWPFPGPTEDTPSEWKAAA